MSPYGQRLASLPDLGVTHPAGDGVEPGGGGQSGQKSNGQPEQSQIPAPSGATLDKAKPDVKFKVVDQLLRSQDRLSRNRYAIDTYFGWIRDGVQFGRLEKQPNQNIWVAKLPNGMTKESSAAIPNKADDLCNKVEDTLMADPPKPDPMPHTEDEAVQQAAKLASEFLLQDGGEAGTNDTETYRWGLNNAFSAASSFLHYVVDKSGGGYQALQVLAHPLAQDPNDPLVAQVPVPPPTDPQTGQPLGPPTTVEERSSEPVLRFVSADGKFVDDATQADRVWLPKIVIERMRREQVRCFPATSTPENCSALVLIRYTNLSDARAEWPDTVGKMSKEDLQAMASWKPPLSERAIPYALRAGIAEGASGPTVDEVGSLSPLLQRRMFSLRLYVSKKPEYQHGYFVDVSGAKGGTVLGEGDLSYEVTLPEKGKDIRCKDIPVVMVRPMQDVRGGDPTGYPFISRFAGSSEAEATLLSAFMDICDNMLHPHVFFRSTASVDEDDWADRVQPIILNPGDGEPTYEHFPTLPPILQLVEHLDTRSDTISGLTETAQGLDSSNSISGVAKNATIRQALVSLSGFQQNLHAAMTRGWRIKCQLAQAEFSTPQMLEFSGSEGSNETKWWTGEDMAGVDQVGIQPGTGTMMTPEGKAQYVAFLQSQQWMDPSQASEVALPGIRMDLGLPENPFEQSIERAVGSWLEGPPDGWVQAKQEQDQVMQQYQQQLQAWQANEAEAQQAQQVQAVEGQQQAGADQMQQQSDAETQKAQLAHEHQLELEKVKAEMQQKLLDQKHAHEAKMNPPPKKTTTIKRNPDGTMTAETVAEPAPKKVA